MIPEDSKSLKTYSPLLYRIGKRLSSSLERLQRTVVRTPNGTLYNMSSTDLEQDMTHLNRILCEIEHDMRLEENGRYDDTNAAMMEKVLDV